jgi:hypothetical protein
MLERETIDVSAQHTFYEFELQVWLGLLPLNFCTSHSSRLGGVMSDTLPDFLDTDGPDIVLKLS